jgi:ATP-dependent protease ClpP protease subunit
MAHRLIADGELILYGAVGGGGFLSPDGFSGAEVVEALAEMDGDITVRVNSGGGAAWDGIAIYNSLRAYKKGRVKIRVDAIAASAASIILQAADERVVPASAMVMIHNASGLTMGTSEDHKKTVEILDKLDGQMAKIYSDVADMKLADVKDMMSAETWMTGKEAVKMGFADSSPREDKKPQASAFHYEMYAKAPGFLKALNHMSPKAAEVIESAPVAEVIEKEPIMAEPKIDEAKPETVAEPVVAAVEPVAVVAAPEASDAGMVAERKRCSDINAACNLVGKGAVAQKYIDAGTSVSEVLATLSAERVPAQETEIVARHTTLKEISATWDKHIDRTNARVAARAN